MSLNNLFIFFLLNRAVSPPLQKLGTTWVRLENSGGVGLSSTVRVEREFGTTMGPQFALAEPVRAQMRTLRGNSGKNERSCAFRRNSFIIKMVVGDGTFQLFNQSSKIIRNQLISN